MSAASSLLMSKGGVTVEDVTDDDDFSLSESEASSSNHSSSSHGRAARPNHSSSSSAASPAAAAVDDGPDNTNRGGLSPGTESAFEVWMRRNVNQPLLDHVVPEWIAPNTISYMNVAVCVIAFLCSYTAYKYEHVYPMLACILRVLMSILIFSGISLDCLDGMQARKTGRTSKLGELLDHSLDAANVPLLACCVLHTIMPDDWTVLISIIGGSMVYNAQLVIYRHQHVMVLPPVTGPTGQALASAASMFFAFFYLFCSRHHYFVRVGITVFAMSGNVAQFQNCHFYYRHLTSSFESSCLAPHLRFCATMCLHGLLLACGWINSSEYMLSATVLAYRLNGRYVLDTLVGYRPFSASYTKAHARAEDREWRVECIVATSLLLALAFFCGSGDEAAILPEGVLPSFMGRSLFHMAHYALMVVAVAANVRDIMQAMPALLLK